MNHLKPSRRLYSAIILGLATYLVSFSLTSGFINKSTKSTGAVLGTTFPESLLSMSVPGVNQDAFGNYIFTLSPVKVSLNLASGPVNAVDSIDAIVHYDPTIVSAQSVDFNQTLNTQYFLYDVMKCKGIYIQKDSFGIETGTILISRTSTPLPDVCPPSLATDDPLGSTFPNYNPMPINQSGTFAQITFLPLINVSTPYLITYDFKSSFPNFYETLNDSNAPAYISVGTRTGNSTDTLSGVSNMSFVIPAPAVPTDTTPPVVTITSPINGSSNYGNVAINASASDNVAIAKVEFYVDGIIQCSDLISPYSCVWDSSTANNGSNHNIVAKAYDTAAIPNTSTDSIDVIVCNGDCTAPSTPTNLRALNITDNSIALSWDASDDNTGISGYYVFRKKSTDANFSQIITLAVGQLNYTDDNLSANTSYTYQIKAFDSAANVSSGSNILTLTTTSSVDRTAPTTPSNLTGLGISTTQINLSWNASTDNISVAGYNVYRSTTGTSGTFNKVNLQLITATSFGNGSLTASTMYTYKVTAVDTAGNESLASNIIDVRTLDIVISSTQIKGTVTIFATGLPVADVKITTTVNNLRVSTVTNNLGQYSFSNIAPGFYSLKFTKTKYGTVTADVTAINGTPYVLDVKLYPKAQ